MNPSAARLILVYNADAGLLNALKDMAHKIIMPATYPCSLCALTYGWAAMRGRWQRFLASLPQAKQFFHRDEFAQAFPRLDVALPVILIAEGTCPPRVLVSATELAGLPDLDSLIALVEERLVLVRLGAPISPAMAG
jgi:hypothetical protein